MKSLADRGHAAELGQVQGIPGAVLQLQGDLEGAEPAYEKALDVCFGRSAARGWCSSAGRLALPRAAAGEGAGAASLIRQSEVRRAAFDDAEVDQSLDLVIQVVRRECLGKRGPTSCWWCG